MKKMIMLVVLMAVAAVTILVEVRSVTGVWETQIGRVVWCGRPPGKVSELSSLSAAQFRIVVKFDDRMAVMDGYGPVGATVQADVLHGTSSWLGIAGDFRSDDAGQSLRRAGRELYYSALNRVVHAPGLTWSEQQARGQWFPKMPSWLW